MGSAHVPTSVPRSDFSLFSVLMADCPNSLISQSFHQVTLLEVTQKSFVNKCDLLLEYLLIILLYLASFMFQFPHEMTLRIYISSYTSS